MRPGGHGGQGAEQASAGRSGVREAICRPGCVSGKVRGGCLVQFGLPSIRKTLMYYVVRGMAGAVTEEEKLREVALFSLKKVKGSQCCCLQLYDGEGYREGEREIQKGIFFP